MWNTAAEPSSRGGGEGGYYCWSIIKVGKGGSEKRRAEHHQWGRERGRERGREGEGVDGWMEEGAVSIGRKNEHLVIRSYVYWRLG